MITGQSLNSLHMKGDKRMDEYRVDETCLANGSIPPLPEEPQVAMAYIPFQQLGSVYTAEKSAGFWNFISRIRQAFLWKKR